MSERNPKATIDPRIAALADRMRGWNCFEPLRPGTLAELAADAIAAVDAVDAVRTDVTAAHNNWARLWEAQRAAIVAEQPRLVTHPHLQEGRE